jgi:hypothetical protein
MFVRSLTKPQRESSSTFCLLRLGTALKSKSLNSFGVGSFAALIRRVTALLSRSDSSALVSLAR